MCILLKIWKFVLNKKQLIVSTSPRNFLLKIRSIINCGFIFIHGNCSIVYKSSSMFWWYVQKQCKVLVLKEILQTNMYKIFILLLRISKFEKTTSSLGTTITPLYYYYMLCNIFFITGKRIYIFFFKNRKLIDKQKWKHTAHTETLEFLKFCSTIYPTFCLCSSIVKKNMGSAIYIFVCCDEFVQPSLEYLIYNEVTHIFIICRPNWSYCVFCVLQMFALPWVEV